MHFVDHRSRYDVHNDNFLGLLELLAHYDPLLKEHVTKVQVAQQKGERLQGYYLSPESQDELISICSVNVRKYILDEREVQSTTPSWWMPPQ